MSSWNQRCLCTQVKSLPGQETATEGEVMGQMCLGLKSFFTLVFSSFGRPGKRRRCRGKHQSAILLNIAPRFACSKSIKEMIFEADLVFSIKGCVCLLQVEMLPPDEAETEGELSMGDDIVKTWNIPPTLPLHGFCWCFDRRHEAQALRTIWSFPQIQKRRGTTKKWNYDGCDVSWWSNTLDVKRVVVFKQ